MAELIVALDYAEARPALDMAEKLRSEVRWFKVGLELFISSGPEAVSALKSMGANVFLDLKIYDIPNTAAKAALACARFAIDLLTIHCQGGFAMCTAVRESLQSLEAAPRVLGVTVLTSFKPGEMPGIDASPAIYAAELAQLAAKAGLYGVVCPAAEALAIKAQNPGLICVCPGIRPKNAPGNDQAQIMSPAEAVANGADFLVVGRPITGAQNPAGAAADILAGMAGAN